jgi:phosphohistidine phosphatase SixA
MRLFDEVFSTKNHIDRLLLVAHNPGTYELARILAGAKDDDFHAGYPTCGLSIFEWDTDSWQDIDQNTTNYHGFITV